MRRRRLSWKWIAGLVVVGGLLLMAMWPRTVPVETTRVVRGPLVVTVDEDGQTRVRERFVVTSPVGGEVLRVELRPGDQIRRGQTVAVVRPAPPVPLDARSRAEAEAAVLAAESALGRLRADRSRLATSLDRATQQGARTRALYAGGAVPREELDAREAERLAAEDAVRAADFAVAQAQHELEAARARLVSGSSTGPLRDFNLASPVDGVVLARHHESRAVVMAGTPLVEIGDPARLEIVADVLSSDAVQIQPGSDVFIEQWGGREALHGRVRRVEPSGFTKVSALGVQEQRVNVIIDFEATEGALALGDGYRVEVRIVTWRGDAVVKVPNGVLFRRGADWAAYVVEDGVARVRTVTVGQRSTAEVQIASGLDEGTSVVLFPPDTLTDGARVRPRVP